MQIYVFLVDKYKKLLYLKKRNIFSNIAFPYIKSNKHS